MRTTVELPSELLRAAKIRAAERGETLKALLTRAVEHEVGRRETRRGQRVSWPLLKTSHKQTRRLTNADLADLLAADDAERVRRRP